MGGQHGSGIHAGAGQQQQGPQHSSMGALDRQKLERWLGQHCAAPHEVIVQGFGAQQKSPPQACLNKIKTSTFASSPFALRFEICAHLCRGDSTSSPSTAHCAEFDVCLPGRLAWSYASLGCQNFKLKIQCLQKFTVASSVAVATPHHMYLYILKAVIIGFSMSPNSS